MNALGEKLFMDPSLSGSGKLACVSYHSPQHAFGPPNGLSVQLGGNDMHRPGFRAVPSLRYLQSVPQFTEHFHDSDDEGDESVSTHSSTAAKLNDAELHGLQLFNDEKKGNCAACHISFHAKDGSPPQLSDFGLIAIGVSRNNDLPINKNPKFQDLGACGPERTDLKGRDEFCGISARRRCAMSRRAKPSSTTASINRSTKWCAFT